MAKVIPSIQRGHEKSHLRGMWFNEDIDLEALNRFNTGMSAQLGIKITGMDEEGMEAIMPVDERTCQPFGILHGGATAALAETVGSFASFLTIDPDKYRTLGMEVHAQHLRSVSSGQVHARAEPIHMGRQVQVWSIRVTDDDARLVAICKLNVMVVPA